MPSTPTIDPEMRPILEELRARAATRAAGPAIPVTEMRQRAAVDLAVWNENPPPLPRVENCDLPGPAGPIPVRLYYPCTDSAPRASLIYCHGGGWVIGSLDTEDYSLRLLAKESGCNVVSVDYRLAPEHRFPAAVEDCIAVVRHLSSEGRKLGVDPDNLAIGGASSGANIALGAAIGLRDSGGSPLKACLLFYGAFATHQSSSSHQRYGNGDYVLSSDAMRYFWDCYLEDESHADLPMASPFNARLHGLPPVHLIAAELDPLRDDSLDLASQLEAAAVPVEYSSYAGVIHGFTVMARDLGVARQALKDAARGLRLHLSVAST